MSKKITLGLRLRRFRVAALSSLALLFYSATSLGQVAVNYGFTQSSGTYVPLVGGTTLTSYTGTSGATSMDDVTLNIPNGTIPFTFQYDGGGYTGLNVNTNGFIAFGATAPTTATYTPLSSTTAYNGAISAFGRDLQGGFMFAATRTAASNVLTGVTNFGPVTVGALLSGTGIAVGATVTAIDTGAGTITMSLNATAAGTATAVQAGGASWSNIQYGTVGSAPNRTFVVQFSGFKRFGSTLTTAQHMSLNFQFRLNESDGAVEVVYNNCSPGLSTFTTVNQVGLRGPNNTFATNVNNRLNTKGTNDNWINSVVGTLNTSGMVFNNVAPANVISNGLTYRWVSAACTGTPAPGNTTATSTNVCNGALFGLGLQNATAGTGVTYQWQSSPDGNDPWTNIGSSSSTQVLSQTSSTYYRCIVTCAGNPGTSTPVLVTGCDCAGAGVCTSAATNVTDEWLSNVTFAGINNNSGSTFYSDFRCGLSGSVIAGDTYLFSSTVSQIGTFTETVKVYIDWNQNSVFEAGEFYLIGSCASNGCIISGNITVPPGANLGNTMVRVAMKFSTPHVDSGCGSYIFGEVEDYQINVTSVPCVSPPTAGTTTASPSSLCTAQIGSNVTLGLSGNTSGSGQSYQWQSSPDGNDPWTNFGTGNATQTVAVSADTYFRCIVTCGGFDDTSTPVEVTITATPGFNISSPIVLTGTGSYPGDNLAPCHASTIGNASPDAWYSFTTSCDATSISASTCVSSFDTFVRILDAGGTQVASDDDLCAAPNSIGSDVANFPVTPNTLYYVVVEGWGTASGTFTLEFSEAVTPILGCTDPAAQNYNPAACTNDGSCTYATPISIAATPAPGCSNYSGSTSIPGMTNLPANGPFPGADADDDVWHTFTLPFDGAVKVKGFSAADIVLELWDGATFLTAVDGFFGGANEIIYFDGLTPGTYQVRVYEYGTGLTANYDLCVTTFRSTQADSPYPSGVYDACGVYKAAFVPGVLGYDWVLTGQNSAQVLTNSSVGNYTFLSLSGLTGGSLLYAETYDVEIGVRYLDADLGAISVFGTVVDPLVTAAAPTSFLTPAYQNATVQLNALIKAQQSCNADGYVWRLTPSGGPALADITVMGTTWLNLATVAVLPGTTYTAEVAVIYGGVQAGFGTPHNFNTLGYVPVVVRSQDRCVNIGAVPLGYIIFTDAFRAGADDYTWEFTPTGGGLPIYHKKGSGNRTLKLSDVAGLIPGTSYDVRVKAEYGNFTGLNGLTGEPQYDFATAYGVAHSVCLIGPASAESNETAENNEEVLSVISGVYPNPTADVVNVSLTGVDASADKISVDIFDLYGKVVFSRQFASQGENFFTTLDLSSLASGVYTLGVTVNEKLETTRIAVVK